MKGKRLLALLLAAVLAAGVLTACGGPGASAGVKLNTGTIEQMLETEGVTAAVAADGELSAAVDEVAASLAQCTLEEIGRLDVKSMVAQKAGVRPLVCEVYGDSYWISTPLGYTSRRERTAAGLIDDLRCASMKCKKFLALVMSAVLSVSMLTACGGGGGGVKDTLSTTQVENLVETAGSDAVIDHNSTMNNIVREAAKDLANGSSQSSVRSTITNKMGWGIVSQIQNFISQFMGSLGILTPNGISMGLVQIVRSDQLEASLSNGGIASHLGAYKDKVTEMKPINTAEKFMATLILAADGTVGQTMNGGENGVGLSYSVSGYEVEDPNGIDYWVFAIEVTMS